MVLEHICPGHTQSWSWHTSWWSFPIPCCTIHVKTGQQLAHMLGLTRCCGHGVAHFITCCDIWIVRSFIIAQFMCQHSMFLMQWTSGKVLHAICWLLWSRTRRSGTLDCLCSSAPPLVVKQDKGFLWLSWHFESAQTEVLSQWQQTEIPPPPSSINLSLTDTTSHNDRRRKWKRCFR